MEGQIEDLKLKKPKFLSAFETEILSNSILPSKWNQSEFFITKNVFCCCGQKQQHLLSTPIIETKGLFKKREVLNHLAPIHIRCSVCNKTNLLLNPEVHGWSGEFKESAAMIGEGEPQLYSDSTGEVIVNYSYQGSENYQQLIEENISNPEDCFDTVTIYFKPAGTSKLQEVVSYVCS